MKKNRAALEKPLEAILHATIPLLLAAVAKLIYDAYFGTHYSDPKALAAQQVLLLNVFIGILVLVLLAIGAGVYMLVIRSEPRPLFEYYGYENDDERDEMHRRIIKIIRGAAVDIKAINAWREEGPPLDAKTPYRDEYFNELIKASYKVPYERLVQVDKSRKIAKEFDSCYVEHFRKMINERDSLRPSRPRIVLDAIEPVVPATFVIVDGKYLLWQLNEVDRERRPDGHKRFWMRAVVIIDDEDFIRHFSQTFDNASKNRGKYAIKLEHLDLKLSAKIGS